MIPQLMFTTNMLIYPVICAYIIVGFQLCLIFIRHSLLNPSPLMDVASRLFMCNYMFSYLVGMWIMLSPWLVFSCGLELEYGRLWFHC